VGEEGQVGEQGQGQPHHAGHGVVGRETVAGSPGPKVPQETAAKVQVYSHELEVVFGEG
jgi:hypothetical protein